MKSIRTRLSAYLLLAAAFTAAVIGAFSYHQTLRESERLFDYQLMQLAQSLRDQGAAPDTPLYGPEDEPHDLVVQIWSSDGAVVYTSHATIPLPDRATLGFADVVTPGGRWRVFSMAARDRIIQVAQPLDLKRGRAAAAALRSLIPLLAFAPLMALLIWWLVGSSLSPLRRLEREVARRDAGALSEVPEAGLPSEIAPLAHALNSLLRRLRLAFSAQREFVANAAHELRTPLTALKLQLQLLDRAPDEPARAEALHQLHQGVDRAGRLIEQLIAAARTDPNDTSAALQPVDVAELARQTIAEVFVLAQARRIGIELEAGGTAVLQADEGGIRTLLRNLIDNAIRYTPEGGAVKVGIAARGERVLLTVDDSGPGIPESERQRVFERFFRLERDDQSGSGLGLSIVKNVAEKHRATVELGVSELGGLKVSIAFPVA
jgi:signal transduction histidine kinase